MICFTRGASFYQIASAYAGGEDYVGLYDGRVVANAPDRAAVARALIQPVIAARRQRRPSRSN
jgi:hypothetical protein